MDIHNALAALAERRDLTDTDTTGLFRQVMRGELTEAQLGALLMGLRVKGETPAEVAGAARAMREFATRVEVDVPHLIDTCGTGGSGQKLFNVSTAAAFVAAAAGAHVAKHGNRKMTSTTGSADVLEAAGVNITLDPDQVAHCIREVGVGFLFAQAHHSALRYAAPVRQQLGVRTLMNFLGPMTNPAGARRQLIGVFAPQWQRTMAEVLRILGAEHVLVVHSNGLDEVRLDTATHVVELQDGEISEYDVTPEDLGVARADTDHLCADSTAASLALVRQSLKEPDSAAAAMVSLNAGGAIYVAGIARTWKQGVAMAEDAIASGLANERLEELIRISSLMAEP